MASELPERPKFDIFQEALLAIRKHQVQIWFVPIEAGQY